MRRLIRRPPRAPGTSPLAPMVDVITILLVGLLQAYSVDAPIRPDDPDFQLPASASEAPVTPVLEIHVTPEAIYVGGERTAGAPYYLEHDDVLIEELYALLQGRGAIPVELAVDARVPYALVRKVLFTAREAGAKQVTLVARARSGM
ncbi:MAG: biopolymer transporter ExbD [Pseudomonadota bacterium]